DGARSRVGQHALDEAESRCEGKHEQDQPAPNHRHHALDPLLARLRLLDVARHRGAARGAAPTRLADEPRSAGGAVDPETRRHARTLAHPAAPKNEGAAGPRPFRSPPKPEEQPARYSPLTLRSPSRSSARLETTL